MMWWTQNYFRDGHFFEVWPGESITMLRGRAKINSYFMAQEFWPPARRERRAYPARGSVRSEQRSPRPKEPAGKCEVIFTRPLSSTFAIFQEPKTVIVLGKRNFGESFCTRVNFYKCAIIPTDLQKPVKSCFSAPAKMAKVELSVHKVFTPRMITAPR